MASHRLFYLMREACRRKLSGVNLKDNAEEPLLADAGKSENFLLG